MAHAFATIPAKPTFGTLRKDLYQSDYLARKTGALIYCNSKKAKCGKLRVAKDFREKLLFSKGKDFINGLRCSKINIPVGNSNLIVGQYSKLNLKPICSVIQNQVNIANLCYDNNADGLNPYSFCDLSGNTVAINSSGNYVVDPSGNLMPFYQLFYIDPCGELFGNSQCGELNYTSYMVINPPINPVL
jgi:hypothetical protein